MTRNARITPAGRPWLAAMALACSIALPGQNAASAQTASDLDCKKCVDTGDIARRAVNRSRLKNNAVNFNKLQDTVGGAVKQDRAFYVTLDSNGAEATLVTQGPLRLFARCIINDAGRDRIVVAMTSTVGGWFTNEDTASRTAGEQVILIDRDVPTTDSFYRELDLVGAVAPDGSAIGPFPLVGLGFNVFGHFCLVHGRTSATTGTP